MLPSGKENISHSQGTFESMIFLCPKVGYVIFPWRVSCTSIAALGIVYNLRLYGYKFFAQASAACPEPLQQISLAPAQTTHWEQRCWGDSNTDGYGEPQ